MLVLIQRRHFNMENGLDMTKEQFLQLPAVQRDGCVFENISELKRLVKGYKLYYKVTTIIGGFLVIGMGILFKFHLGVN